MAEPVRHSSASSLDDKPEVNLRLRGTPDYRKVCCFGSREGPPAHLRGDQSQRASHARNSTPLQQVALGRPSAVTANWNAEEALGYQRNRFSSDWGRCGNIRLHTIRIIIWCSAGITISHVLGGLLDVHEAGESIIMS